MSRQTQLHTPVQAGQAPPQRRPNRARRARRFMIFWLLLTLLVGVGSFGGIYVAAGSLDDSNDDGVTVEVQAEPNANQGAPAQADDAPMPTATTVSLNNVPQGQNEVAQAPSADDANNDPSAAPVAASDDPAMPSDDMAAEDAAPDPVEPQPIQEEPTATLGPPTPIPTINPPVAAYDGPPLLPPGFGIGAHFNGDYSDEAALDYMRVAGMNWVKIQIRYESGMDANDYGWQVQLNHENGFRILWGVVGEPEDLLEPGYYQEYAEFVGRLAEIGSDAIEIWNEVNLDREWPAGRVDPAMYTEFLRVSYEEIKSRNPDTIVIGAGLAPTGFFGGRCTPQGCDDDVYYQGMAAAGAGQYMDCIGAHYNEGIISPVLLSGDPRDTDAGTRYLVSNTDRAWLPFNQGVAVEDQLPVCYTELGYLTPEGYGPLPDNFNWASNVTLQQHASWLGTAALINAHSGKVDMMIIWNLNYETYGEFDPHGGYAVVRPDGSCPACDTLGSLR